LAPVRHEIVGQGLQNRKRTTEVASWLPKNNFLAAAKDLDLLHVEAEFFGPAHGLAISGPDASGFGHGQNLPSKVYTICIYFAITMGAALTSRNVVSNTPAS